MAAAALAASLLLRSPYMTYAIYAFLLLVFIANLSSRAWTSGLHVTRSLSSDTVRQGEEVEIEVIVENRRGWPIPWIYVEDFAPPDFPLRGDNRQLTMLMPGRSITLKYLLQCPRRGYHRLGPVLYESGDLFGLQRRFKTGEQQDYVSVLPTVAYIDTFNIGMRRPQGAVRISNRIYEDPTRISGLREYVPGDPMSRIHWKASARHGQLFVKQNEPANVRGGTLILDLFDAWYQDDNGAQRMELAITTAASIAYLLHVSGEQVGLVTNARDAAEVARYEVTSEVRLSRAEAKTAVEESLDSDKLNPLTVPTMRSSIQGQRIIENLARVLPADGLDCGQLILSEFRRLPRDATMLPVLPNITEDLAHILAQMKTSGFPVTVFIIANNAAYERAAIMLAPYNIHVFHIRHERDLHEISPARIG